ncbi:sensor histidine kinase [Pararobbsia silviterrae]|uniref:histidine kinase n=1 Tax=Pararobbsia silviterrae TaxID=1792498 RepID=A0A494YE66_9BURK|nr:ATP-binding protein [Pararobbsia silviterrae]RKP59008.1 two-component sensor histidine kinase [Pararobbsia silviterrae]
MSSIRRRLLLWLLMTVLVGLVIAGFLIRSQALAEANEIFDFQLQQTAAALPSESFSSVFGSNGDTDEGVVIQIWSRTGVLLYYSRPNAQLAPNAALGFSTQHTPHGDWRVYGAMVGDNVVQLAQPMSVRDHLAAQMAWRTILPLLVLLPLLAIIVWLVVGRGLLPLQRFARALDVRKPDALEPLQDTMLPEEIQPLAKALNGLLGRLGQSLDAQKAFVADAAHELRTPLAALRIQLQLLERARADEDRTEALGDLKKGVERATRLVEQLLALARSEPGGDAASVSRERVDLTAMLLECVTAHAPIAQGKRVDLGVGEQAHAEVDGQAPALRVMLNNVLDNAVKYTPEGGRIDVSVTRAEHDGAAVARVVVDDSGPGIPVSERERVFDRFYRGVHDTGRDPSGSGLGLAIVRRIAERHGATVKLADSANGAGLRVTIDFPLVARAGAPAV